MWVTLTGCLKWWGVAFGTRSVVVKSNFCKYMHARTLVSIDVPEVA